jgi:hypothetical protein
MASPAHVKSFFQSELTAADHALGAWISTAPLVMLESFPLTPITSFKGRTLSRHDHRKIASGDFLFKLKH